MNENLLINLDILLDVALLERKNNFFIDQI